MKEQEARMATDKHNDIRAFMEQMKASGGNPPSGKRMVLNPQTGKFEVRSVGDRPGDQIPHVSAEDMKAFTHD
ncbi:hypothetical protein [Nonomuraea sp. NEAU-A123]|uniref:hypothetical protein n=1 Tax=Nonomuraea sp. NEAU-A123 TaxID=2839649 RepID=UPI001BE3FB74|nr:hypothetical protein [Nonomuraea sp. NEAU-A123]MBT2232986.1 hypothetical protein [Nonomuraea sp. NEAU-A123]